MIIIVVVLFFLLVLSMYFLYIMWDKNQTLNRLIELHYKVGEREHQRAMKLAFETIHDNREVYQKKERDFVRQLEEVSSQKSNSDYEVGTLKVDLRNARREIEVLKQTVKDLEEVERLAKELLSSHPH